MSQNRLSVSTYIPESLGSEDVLFENAPFVGTIEFIDGVIIFSPGFAFLLFGESILPTILEPYVIFFSILLILMGMSLLLMKPNYMSLKQWFSTIKSYRSREKELTKNYTTEDGKPFESISVVPDDDTRKLTKLDKVYPERNVIELEDGTLISILEFSGSNLDMASNELIMSTINQYSSRLSSQLQNKIQFYMPMRPVSLEPTSKLYENQLDNLNVRNTDDQFMEMYLDDRMTWVKTISKSSFVREQYVVIPVEESEIIRNDINTGKTGLDNVPGGTLLKDIYNGLLGKSVVESKQEIKRRQLREIEKRRSSIISTLSVGPGNKGKVVGYKKCIALAKEFWEGEKIQTDEMDALSVDYDFNISTFSNNNDIDSNKGDEK